MLLIRNSPRVLMDQEVGIVSVNWTSQGLTWQSFCHSWTHVLLGSKTLGEEFWICPQEYATHKTHPSQTLNMSVFSTEVFMSYITFFLIILFNSYSMYAIYKCKNLIIMMQLQSVEMYRTNQNQFLSSNEKWISGGLCCIQYLFRF